MINEQKIFLSEESVENLINYNGFLLTFVMLVGINILIRQVMINIVAIYMHDDYHKSKIEFAEEQKRLKAIQKDLDEIQINKMIEDELKR